MSRHNQANSGFQDAYAHHVRADEATELALKASKVAIHVRPRSPKYSPAKYYPPDERGSSAQQDVRPQLDVSDRARSLTPLLHLEVDRTGPVPWTQNGQLPATGTPGPQAIIDVFQVSGRGGAHGRPSAAASAATVTITMQPQARRGRAAGAVNRDTALEAKEPDPRVPQGRQADGTLVGVASSSSHIAAKDMPAALPVSVTAAAAQGSAFTARPAASAHGALPLSGRSRPEQPAPTGSAGAGRPQAAAPASGAGAALLAELFGRDLSAPNTSAADRTESAYPAANKPYSAASAPRAAGALLNPASDASPWAKVAVAPGPARRVGAEPMTAWSLSSSWGAWPGGVSQPPGPDEEARRARRRHRKRIARIVVDHWKAFAAGRLRALAARRQYRKRLLNAAVVAWRAETTACRARMRQAAVYDLKRSYLRLGKCVQAWSAAAKRLAQLRSLLEQATINRLLRRSRACLRAWRGRCYYTAEKRRRMLQAWYYWCFATLTRVIRNWRSWAVSRRAKAARAAWAETQHVKALGRKAFAAWRSRRAYLAWKTGARSRAGASWRCWTLRRALRAWSATAVAAAGARAEASEALVAVAARLEAGRAVEVLREWQAYAAGRRLRRQRERYAQAYLRRWRQLVLMWAWRQRVARSKHLRVCGRELERVGQRTRLALSWSRWVLSVEVLQGQRTTELRAAVLQRACWATWRAVVEHGAAKRELLQIATQRVGRVVAAAALATWRSRAAHWRAKAERWARAEAWHRRRALGKLVLGWRCEAARLVAKAAAVEVAERHLRHKVLRKAVRLWRRYAWRQFMKAVAADRHLLRMAAAVLRGWLQHTRYKMNKELNRRKAVRHRYLTLLHSGLLAFRAAVERRHAKQADWADLARFHSLHVARSVMSAWRLQFMPMARVKRAVSRRADAQRQAWLLRRTVSGWAEQATRLAAKHARYREAAGFAGLQLLRRVLAHWAAAPALQEARRAAKAARLEALRGELAAAATRRLLAAWVEVHGDLVMKRLQDTRARAAWRDRTLRRALTCWAVYLARRRTKRQLTLRAASLYRQRACREALAALARRVQGRRVKRRLEAVAWEHRRLGLLRRSLAVLGWYARYRTAKSRGYAQARAMYIRNLQREGAVAWLEVGLERRQRRIQRLAAEQARTLAEQLSLVEPFARRWLHTVRARRRGRLMAGVSGAADRALLGVLFPQPYVLGGSSGAAFSAAGGGTRFPGRHPAIGGVADATTLGSKARAGLAFQGATQLPTGLGSAGAGGPFFTTAAGLPSVAGRRDLPLTPSAHVGHSGPIRRPQPRTPSPESWTARPDIPGATANPSAPPPPAATAVASAGIAGASGPSSFPGGGANQPGATVRRSRPQPRCPDFLQFPRRPATVSEASAAAAAPSPWLQPGHRPASSAAPGGTPAWSSEAFTGFAQGGRSGVGASVVAPGAQGNGGEAASGFPAGELSLRPLSAALELGRWTESRPATAAGGSRPAGGAWPGPQPLFYANLPAPVTAAQTTTAAPGMPAPAALVAGAAMAAAGAGAAGMPRPQAPGVYTGLPAQSAAPWQHGSHHQQVGGFAFETGAATAGLNTTRTHGAQAPPSLPFPPGFQPPSIHAPPVAAAGWGGWVPSAAGGGPFPAAPGDAVMPSSSPLSEGITIHQPGPGPPDVLRLPSRGGGDLSAGSSLPSETAGYAGHPASAAVPPQLPRRAAAGVRDGAPAAAAVPIREAAGSQSQQGWVLRQNEVSDLRSNPTGAPYGDPGRPAAAVASGINRSPLEPAPARPVPQLQKESATTLATAPMSQPVRQVSEPLAPVDEQELAELESVLLHCKRLKGLLQQLEGTGSGSHSGGNGSGGNAWGADGVPTGAGVGAGVEELERSEAAPGERERQVEEVRAALAALRPTVEYAALRLRKIRGLAC